MRLLCLLALSCAGVAACAARGAHDASGRTGAATTLVPHGSGFVPASGGHHLVVLEDPLPGAPSDSVVPGDVPGATEGTGAPGTTAGTIQAEAPFACDELVPSWNFDADPDEALVVEVSVGDGRDWSSWLVVGHLGAIPSAKGITTEQAGAWGRTACDTFVATRPFQRARLRVRAWDGGLVQGRFERVAFCFSKWGAGADAPRVAGASVPESRPEPATVRLDVPFRSQRSEAPELAPRICSPTSVAMVLAYHGVTVATAELAGRIYDEACELYGNWSRAVQVAYEFGLPGYVARFDDWSEVERVLASGTPLVISVRAEPGELAGAAFAATEGHLLVVRGFAEGGRVLVNDPAFEDAAGGVTSYSRADLERVWWQRRRGTAYVLGHPPAPNGPNDSAARPR